MTPEEYERFKEAEKEHLRKLKKLKEAARVLERQKKISDAVTSMTSSMEAKFDEHREMVDRLGMEAAMTEARMEVAMDSTEDRAQQINSDAEDEEVLRKARARELIRQMQQESGSAPAESGSASQNTRSASETSSRSTTKSTQSDAKSPESSSKLPEKTIGRMKP